jgi:diguanylate cyclase (GGDEF)-like protein
LRRSRSSRALKEQVVLARHAAATDGLTGLYNRRHLDRDLADRVARAQASGHGFALVLIDLDHFKRINDEYGHGVGDLVLREVSDAVRAGIRVTDTAFRYGGEELCIVLPGTPAREALGCVERIRQRVVSRAFGPVTRGAVTFSAGLADWSDGDTPQNLLDRADRTLFRAKGSGRNTARVALEDRDE